MKINMWKLLFAALIASTAMVACKDERNNYMVDDTISFLATDNQLINVALYNEECDLTVIKSGKGQTGATARLEVSEAALEAYNTANGTDYKALPANYVTFSPAIKFSEKDIRKTVMMPGNAKLRHIEIEKRNKELAEAANTLPINRVEMNDTKKETMPSQSNYPSTTTRWRFPKPAR